MATQRKQRTKNDLSRLSAWPHPVQSRTGARHSKPAAEIRSRSEPEPVRTPLHKAIAYDLPALYHETYLRVIPLDPWRLFSFWVVTPNTSETIEKTCPPLLRLYETDGKTVTDYTVEKGTHSQYIRVPEPGLRYRLEYGISLSGRFVPLCASNEVAVPAAGVRELKVNMKKGGQADTEALIGFSARSLTVAAAPDDSAADFVTGLALTSCSCLPSDT
jgi:hypothetical protein